MIALTTLLTTIVSGSIIGWLINIVIFTLIFAFIWWFVFDVVGVKAPWDKPLRILIALLFLILVLSMFAGYPIIKWKI